MLLSYISLDVRNHLVFFPKKTLKVLSNNFIKTISFQVVVIIFFCLSRFICISYISEPLNDTASFKRLVTIWAIVTGLNQSFSSSVTILKDSTVTLPILIENTSKELKLVAKHYKTLSSKKMKIKGYKNLIHAVSQQHINFHIAYKKILKRWQS